MVFPGTQAFASPPDLASSGVWENIIKLVALLLDTCIRWCLSKTFPTISSIFFYFLPPICHINGFSLLPNVCYMVLGKSTLVQSYFYDSCYVKGIYILRCCSGRCYCQWHICHHVLAIL